MKLFLNYILFLTPLLTLSCAAGDAGSNMNGGTSTRSERDTYYATDEEGDDFAQIPTAVAGGFQLLDCNYKQPSVSDSSADIGCAAKDEYGERSDITDLIEPKIQVTKHQNLTSEVSECDESDSCHWKVRVSKNNPDVKISSELKKMNFMLRARTTGGEEVSIPSDTQILAISESDMEDRNIYCNDEKDCKGEKGASCAETCEAVGLRFNETPTDLKWCEKKRGGQFKPGNLGHNSDIYHKGNKWKGWRIGPYKEKWGWVLTGNEPANRTSGAKVYVPGVNIGCGALLENKTLNYQGWHFIKSKNDGDAHSSLPNVKRYCSCK
jgi:hypothetical protein